MKIDPKKREGKEVVWTTEMTREEIAKLYPYPQVDPDELDSWTIKIIEMTHEEMAKLYRFAPAGHIVFRRDLPLRDIFINRFKSFGGMTPEILLKLRKDDDCG